MGEHRSRRSSTLATRRCGSRHSRTGSLSFSRARCLSSYRYFFAIAVLRALWGNVAWGPGQFFGQSKSRCLFADKCLVSRRSGRPS